MSNHLSHDQMSRCVLGQATSDEEAHGRRCPECRAELAHFTNAVSAFQGAMREWSEGEPVRLLGNVPSRVSWWRWPVAAAAIVVLAVVPLYEWSEAERPVTQPEIISDELLMEAVAAHLSRPLPLSMERVLALLPEVDQEKQPEREEIR